MSVLLVEAGGHFGWLSSVPLLAPMMQGTEVDWAYKTEPQVFSSRGLNGYVTIFIFRFPLVRNNGKTTSVIAHVAY